MTRGLRVERRALKDRRREQIRRTFIRSPYRDQGSVVQEGRRVALKKNKKNLGKATEKGRSAGRRRRERGTLGNSPPGRRLVNGGGHHIQSGKQTQRKKYMKRTTARKKKPNIKKNDQRNSALDRGCKEKKNRGGRRWLHITRAIKTLIQKENISQSYVGKAGAEKFYTKRATE